MTEKDLIHEALEEGDNQPDDVKMLIAFFNHIRDSGPDFNLPTSPFLYAPIGDTISKDYPIIFTSVSSFEIFLSEQIDAKSEAGVALTFKRECDFAKTGIIRNGDQLSAQVGVIDVCKSVFKILQVFDPKYHIEFRLPCQLLFQLFL